MTRFRLLAPLVFVSLAAPAFADPAVGLWKTEPDRKNLTSHIQIATCGAALCGTVVKAFDAQGNAVKTANVGKRLFWDLKPGSSGNYDGGTVFVPLLNVTANAKAKLSGNTLRVTGCKALVCDGQTWTRVN
ncbi:imidazoleglycerol-phosphate dehydratase [Antarctobacter heliothermus]|uniref:Imidazoleglycerol-phosphate dehydratase n=1 Tax=Antarctobacter heliothermus TaxID=74033 RepID=A0A222E9C1_9RHOB|nr:DUF2147 domain-containing protein [Antarctobacter heliothermus]ASP22670.1 imidazoleglycerol-phosphate dehydratase [Antarctobacter heliothermus]MBT52948.1 DUF2147 domain-containing protein [Mameliella sp.]|tara:strand:- start:164 stop:556 length:393 start_codon:yes stop_codon:yes gene_type:complete